jgi:hypothetical protein
LHGAGHAPRGFVLKSFMDPREVRTALESSTLPSVPFRVRVAGRDGIARLHVQGIKPEAAAPPPPAVKGRRNDTSPLELKFALPPIRLARRDAMSITPGDVLLAGVTDLAAFGADGRIVTTNGWSLAGAAIVRDSPTVLTVRCGRFALETLSVGVGEAEAVLHCLIGTQKMSPEQIRYWQNGATIDLTKDPALPVDVYDGLTRIARGELVKLDGEIGVRVVEVTKR